MCLLKKKASYLAEDDEVWITAKGLYDYEVSTYGGVRKYFETKKGKSYYREPNQIVTQSNGLIVNIIDNKAGVRSQKSVAKLIYNSFMDTDVNFDIMFIDGNKENCSLYNMVSSEEIAELYKNKIDSLIEIEKSNIEKY